MTCSPSANRGRKSPSVKQERSWRLRGVLGEGELVAGIGGASWAGSYFSVHHVQRHPPQPSIRVGLGDEGIIMPALDYALDYAMARCHWSSA